MVITVSFVDRARGPGIQKNDCPKIVTIFCINYVALLYGIRVDGKVDSYNFMQSSVGRYNIFF